MNKSIKKVIVKCSIVLFWLIVIGKISAQERSLTIIGTAETNYKPLANAKVTLLKKGVVDQTLFTGSDGIFRFNLALNQEYTVVLEKQGLLSKKIAFNTELPDDISKQWTVEFAMGLFEGCEGVDTKVLDNPVDVVKFSANKSEFISDKVYTEKIKSGIEKLFTDIEACQADKSVAQLKVADDLFNKKQFEEARSKYQEILNTYPDDSYCKKKIAEIDKKIGQEKVSDQKYNEAIAEADKLYAAKNYEMAKAKYQEALLAMPSNKYPSDKIAAIDNLINTQKSAELEKLDKEKQYNSFISKANLAFTNKNFEEAKSMYQQALLVKPDAVLPKQKITELDPLIAKQKQESVNNAANDKAFNETMAMGQTAFQKNDLATAQQYYNKALTINPQASLPRQKIAEIDKITEQQKLNETKAQKAENEKKIIAALDEGDMYFKQKKYDEADAAYQRALQLNPKEEYAKQQVDKIYSYKQAADVEKQKTLEKDIKESISKADMLVASSSYQQAIEVYKQALLLKPNDPALQAKLSGAEQKLSAEQQKKAGDQAKQKEYDQYLFKGNSLLLSKNYIQAKDEFQKAVIIFPDQPAAKGKIVEIDKILSAQKQQEQYKDLITKADGIFAAKDYMQAKTIYQQALAVKPDETYPQQKVTEIDKLVSENKKLAAEQLARDEQFKKLTADGDRLLAAGNIAESKLAFQNALKIKPDDKYSKDQIAKIDAQVADKLKKESDAKAKDQQFSAAIAQADQLFAANKNMEAKVQYQQALAINPGDAYPASQIAKIDARVAEQLKKESDAKAKDQQYSATISQADQLFAANKNIEAKVQYQQALAIKPGDAYPTSQIAKIDARVAEQMKKESDAKAKDQQFTTSITQADQLFAANKNIEAKVQYQQALAIKPGDAYPASQIAKIEARVAEQLKKESEAKAKDQQYSAAISQADQLFAANKNIEAKVQYQQALAIKPGDAYPTSQITKIDARFAEQLKKESDAKAKDQQFSAVIAQADQLFAANKNIEAKVQYQQALAIKPGDAYPTSQITKIDARFAEQLKKESDAKAKDQQFSAVIAQADQLFAANKNTEAKVQYQQALAIKPGDAYPTSQITKIDARFAEQLKKESDAKAKDQQYSAAIAQADKLFSTNKNQEAKAQYQQALAIKPGDAYPTAQIAKIDALIAEQLKKEADNKAKELQFKTTIATADQLFSANKKQEAKVQYQQALVIKPGDAYPTSQIAKIDAQFADELKKENDLKALEQKYKTTITQADQFYNTNKLIEAKAYYEQAMAIKPTEKYPAEQVKIVSAKLLQIEKEKQAKLEFEEKYNSTIKNADLAYDAKDFVKARELYNQALTMKPSETYPQDRLNKITEYEKMVAKEQAARKQTSTTTSTTTEKPKSKSALAELKFANDSERDKYLNSLKASYPVGVTLEVHNEEFKSTRRYIVIRDNEVREFRMVKFNWGGVEYSLNGIPITGQYFDTQVKSRAGEAYQEIKQ